jgi:hypothetical protein
MGPIPGVGLVVPIPIGRVRFQGLVGKKGWLTHSYGFGRMAQPKPYR